MKTKRKVLFLRGDGPPFSSEKQQRNKPCACGSGKKQKKCCGTETKYFLNKKTK